MAVINYAEYFDLDGFNKAIKDLETTNKEFSNSVLSLNKEIKVSYNGIKAELKDWLDFLSKFNVSQRNSGTILAEVGAESQKQIARFKEQEKAMQGLTQVQDLSRASLKELKAALKELERQYSELGGASAELNAKKAALAAESRRVREQIDLQKTALKATKQVVDDAAGSYNAMNKEAKSILRELKAMPNAFDATTGKINQNNAAAVELQTRYLSLDKSLKSVDAGLGMFYRNVGNYKSGFSGLSNSVNQITREFPAFSNSVQTGFLAISNNLPIFFDELQRANAQIKELQAQGQKVPGLFATLGKSILSFNSLLSLGVTLLTVFGKDIADFADRLMSSANKVDVFAESVNSLKEAYKSSEYKKVVSDVNELKSAVNLAKQGFIDKKDVVNKYNETLGKTAGVVTTLSEVEDKLTSKAQDIIDFTLLKARANIVLAKAAEAAGNAEIRALEGPSFQDKLLGFMNTISGPAGLANLNSENLSKDISSQLNRGILGAKIDAKALRDLFEKLDAEASEFARKKGLNILGNSKIDKAAENKALNDYRKSLDDRQKLLKETFDKEILDAQSLLDQKIISEVEFQDKKYQATVNYTRLATEEELKINSVGFKAREDKLAEFDNFRKAAGNEYLKTLISEDAKALEFKKGAIQTEADFKIESLKDEQRYVLSNQNLTNAERLKLEIDYQNQIDEIAIQAILDRAALEVDIAKKTDLLKQASTLRRGVDNRNAFTGAVAGPQAQAQDDSDILARELQRKKLFNILTVQEEIRVTEEIINIKKAAGIKTLEDEEKLNQLRKRQQDEILSYLKDSASQIGGIFGGPYDALFNSLIDGFQKVKNTGKITFQEIGQFAKASADAYTASYKQGLDEQIRALQVQKQVELEAAGNNASARAAIEAKYLREQAVLNRKKAKADRDNALFQIAINTAMGVSSAASSVFTLPLIPGIIAIGAIQAALVLSRKIPQFKKGTENSPEGPAIVDDGGGPELIIGPDGRIREIGGNGPRLTYLEKGSKVKTAEETKRLLSDPYGRFNRELADMQRSTKVLTDLKQAEAIHIMSKAMANSGMDEKVITAAFERAIKNIPIHQTLIDRHGERLRVKEGENTTTYLNSFKIGR